MRWQCSANPCFIPEKEFAGTSLSPYRQHTFNASFCQRAWLKKLNSFLLRFFLSHIMDMHCRLGEIVQPVIN